MFSPIAHSNGIFGIKFFDTTSDIIEKIGVPDKIFLDNADRKVFTYNMLKTHFVFDANAKSYMIKYYCYDTNVLYEGIALKNYTSKDIKPLIEEKTNKHFETTVFDTYTDVQCDGLCIEYNYEEFYALICVSNGGDMFEI